MPVPPSEYRNYLDNLEKTQKVVIQNYKNTLIDYKASPTNENKALYYKYENQLKTDIFSKLFILENKINKSISQNKHVHTPHSPHSQCHKPSTNQERERTRAAHTQQTTEICIVHAHAHAHV